MQNSAKELEICQKLKPLENKIFNTKTALFDALADAGVQLTKGYRTGSKNRKDTICMVKRKMRRTTAAASSSISQWYLFSGSFL